MKAAWLRWLATLVLGFGTVSGCGGSSRSHDDAHAGTTGAGSTSGGSSSGAGAGMSGGSGGESAGQAGTSVGGAGGVPAACATCGVERSCCDDHCVNLANDPLNCGRCGQECSASQYCTAGECVAKPCDATCADSASCCGSECCTAGQLCCDPQGPIETGARCVAPSDTNTCPMGCAPLCKCLSPDTPIATPTGARAVASLAVGDLVYSVDGGAVKAVPIARVGRMSVTGHEVVRVKLVNGAVLEISGTHPTAEGGSFDRLRAGDQLGHVAVLSVERIPYAYSLTYDILPNSTSGAYFAGGALIASTLAPFHTPIDY